MPIITNLQSTLVRDANTAFALGLFRRAKDLTFPKLAGHTLSTADVEPYVTNGASPLPKRFFGSVQSQGTSSFTWNVPNILFKSVEQIDRSTFELDQTRTVIERAKAIGVTLSQFPDYLLAKRLMTAEQSSSATITWRNTTYNTTPENGVPLFSTAHTLSGSNQSNIIGGSLPVATTSALSSYDLATQANAMVRDLQQAIVSFQSFVDDKGIPIYPSLDPEKQIVVVVPPALKPAAELAFMAPGSVIGGSPGTTGSTGSTSAVGHRWVKDVISFGLLETIPDVESETGATVSPEYQLQYYFMIVDDAMGQRALNFQQWRPKKKGETIPLGEDVEAMADSVLEAAKEAGFGDIPREIAHFYNFMQVDTNLNAVGNNAQDGPVFSEQFFMSGRTRFNFAYGWWFTAIKVNPDSYTS